MKTLMVLLGLVRVAFAGELLPDEQLWLNQIESVRQRGAWVADEAIVKLFVGIPDSPPTDADGDFVVDGKFRWVNEDRTKGEIHKIRLIHTQVMSDGKKLPDRTYYWLEKTLVFELKEKSKK